jgi:hypothetical protein
MREAPGPRLLASLNSKPRGQTTMSLLDLWVMLPSNGRSVHVGMAWCVQEEDYLLRGGVPIAERVRRHYPQVQEQWPIRRGSV